MRDYFLQDAGPLLPGVFSCGIGGLLGLHLGYGQWGCTALAVLAAVLIPTLIGMLPGDDPAQDAPEEAVLDPATMKAWTAETDQGVELLHAGRVQEALPILERGMARGDRWAFTNYGMAMAKLGHDAEAERALRIAYERGQEEASIALSMLLLKRHDVHAAEPFLRHAVALGDPTAIRALAILEGDESKASQPG